MQMSEQQETYDADDATALRGVLALMPTQARCETH